MAVSSSTTSRRGRSRPGAGGRFGAFFPSARPISFLARSATRLACPPSTTSLPPARPPSSLTSASPPALAPQRTQRFPPSPPWRRRPRPRSCLPRRPRRPPPACPRPPRSIQPSRPTRPRSPPAKTPTSTTSQTRPSSTTRTSSSRSRARYVPSLDPSRAKGGGSGLLALRGPNPPPARPTPISGAGPFSQGSRLTPLCSPLRLQSAKLGRLTRLNALLDKSSIYTRVSRSSSPSCPPRASFPPVRRMLPARWPANPHRPPLPC